MNKPSKNVKKGGIAGVITAICAIISQNVIGVLSLPEGYIAPFTGVLVAAVLGIVDYFKHR